LWNIAFVVFEIAVKYPKITLHSSRIAMWES